jgi:hypothetical protein
MNDIDMNTEPGKKALKDIIKSLHKLSDDVVNQSQQMESMKAEIKDNQLALRNIIANNEILRTQYLAKKFEFWLIVFLLVVLVGVCGALIIFNMSQFVFYIAGAILISILIMKLVQLIKSFISKN